MEMFEYKEISAMSLHLISSSFSFLRELYLLYVKFLTASIFLECNEHKQAESKSKRTIPK